MCLLLIRQLLATILQENMNSLHEQFLSRLATWWRSDNAPSCSVAIIEFVNASLEAPVFEVRKKDLFSKCGNNVQEDIANSTRTELHVVTTNEL